VTFWDTYRDEGVYEEAFIGENSGQGTGGKGASAGIYKTLADSQAQSFKELCGQ
jgi:hypothetical protein